MSGISLLLTATGAVLAFAVADRIDGVDLSAVGYILMGVGLIGLIVSLVQSGFGGVRSRTERTVSADGRSVVEDQRTTTL